MHLNLYLTPAQAEELENALGKPIPDGWNVIVLETSLCEEEATSTEA